jgi:hypothetical protein
MEEHRFQSALKNHPEHARILGLIADTCNMVERVLCEAIAFTLSITDEQTESFYYSIQTSRGHFDVAAGVLSRFTEPESVQKQYLRQIDIARRLFARRNSMMHNQWDSRRKTAAILVFSETPKSRSRFRPVSTKEMEKLLTELEDCLNAIVDISIAAYPWKP